VSDDELQAHILAAFGLKPWDITASVRPPLRIRFWRAVTFARRRSKVIDWQLYEEVEAELRARDEAFKADLPRRKQELAGEFSDMLPDGMRFEWAPDD
jgi:hypothetical protein